MRIYEERERQIRSEGWSAEHDDAHTHGELRRAAECYERAPALRSPQSTVHSPPSPLHIPPKGWPWDPEWWKPSTDRARELEKAGALFLAEAARQSRANHFPTAKRMKARAIACGKQIDRLAREGATKAEWNIAEKVAGVFEIGMRVIRRRDPLTIILFNKPDRRN